MKSFRFRWILFFLMACSYSERGDWDSGSKAQDAYQEEARQQEEENVNDQFPMTEPGTESPQPF